MLSTRRTTTKKKKIVNALLRAARVSDAQSQQTHDRDVHRQMKTYRRMHSRLVRLGLGIVVAHQKMNNRPQLSANRSKK